MQQDMEDTGMHTPKPTIILPNRVDEQDHTAAGNQEVAEQDGLPAALVN